MFFQGNIGGKKKKNFSALDGKTLRLGGLHICV